MGPPGKNFSNHHCSLIFSSKDVVTLSMRINFNYSAHTINWLIAQSIERYHSSRSLALGRHVPKQIINIHSYLPDSSSLLPLFPSHRLCGGPSCPLPWLHGMRNFQVNFAYTRLSYIDILHYHTHYTYHVLYISQGCLGYIVCTKFGTPYYICIGT